jgi:steroid delta-isomerase-like uncharacterized protein
MRTGFIFVGLLATFGAVACGGDDKEPPKMPPPPTPPVVTATASVTPTPTATETSTPPVTPPKPTAAEMQQATAKGVAEALNAHDAKKFSSHYTADAVLHVIGMPEVKGTADLEKDVQVYFTAFPDVKFALSRCAQKGDMSVCEWVANGTHSGDLMGLKPSQKPVGYHGASVVWFDADGKIKQEHRYFDMATIMGQVGAIKVPTRPVPPLPTNTEWVASAGTPDEEKNVEAQKAAYAAMDSKKVDDFLVHLSDDVTFSDLTQPADQKGKKAAKDFLAMLFKAVPDAKGSTSTIFGAGDHVFAEMSVSGTWKGNMGPMKATGKPMTVHGLDVMHYKDGKIVSGVSYGNAKEILDAAGMWPKPPAAPAPKKTP